MNKRLKIVLAIFVSFALSASVGGGFYTTAVTGAGERSVFAASGLSAATVGSEFTVYAVLSGFSGIRGLFIKPLYDGEQLELVSMELGGVGESILSDVETGEDPSGVLLFAEDRDADGAAAVCVFRAAEGAARSRTLIGFEVIAKARGEDGKEHNETVTSDYCIVDLIPASESEYGTVQSVTASDSSEGEPARETSCEIESTVGASDDEKKQAVERTFDYNKDGKVNAADLVILIKKSDSAESDERGTGVDTAGLLVWLMRSIAASCKL